MKPILFLLIIISILSAQQDDLPYYLNDRGEGIPTSMFGTYIGKGEFRVYPFYEFYWDHNAEYSPADFDFADTSDYRGKGIAHEGLLYAAYGITSFLMVEFEAAVITETLWKSDSDNSGMPDSIKESGLGDVEGQIRWRYFPEKEKRPELFSYLEIVLPLQPDRQLIGTQFWEFKLGVGAVKGFRIGTFTTRFGVEYDAGEKEVGLGEYALEYLKRLNQTWRIFTMVEGSEDEVELILEGQVHFNQHVYLKAGSGFGLTSKATDIAPEIGVMLCF